MGLVVENLEFVEIDRIDSGTTAHQDLRETERAKITCGEEHFKAIGVMEPPARYVVAKTFGELMNEAAER